MTDIAPKTLKASKHIDADTGFRFRHVKSETEYFRPHDHEYHEIFLVLCGSAEHYVNGSSFRTESGQLIFVRDFDTHDYRCVSGDFEFLNLAFSRDTLERLCVYLGKGFSECMRTLTGEKYPPLARLTESETQKLRMKLAELNSPSISDRAMLKARMRRLLADIFTDCFTIRENVSDEVPFWLENAVEKIKLPKNFILGRNRFYELCGRTREHSSRSLARFYGVTPTELVNSLRLGYAANLLLSSNLTATDVCYECGFRNLSWFYSAFEERFGKSPAEYRRCSGKTAEQKSIPSSANLQ